jgi:S1-C subfamily serine protease
VVIRGFLHFVAPVGSPPLRLCVAAVLLLAVLAQPALAGLPETITRIKPGILGIGTVQLTRRPAGQFTGTGFVVGDGLHAITNVHVLPAQIDRDHKEFLAVLTDAGAQEGVREATVVSTDPDHDVALLRFKGSPLPALKLGDSDRVREGEHFVFTGFPIGMALGMRPVTHQALVSAVTPIVLPQISARTLDPKMVQRLGSPYNVFQLDATAYPGNSGSPLYHPETGQVVGIINKVFVKETKENLLKEPSGITYAIPSKFAAALLRKAGVTE